MTKEQRRQRRAKWDAINSPNPEVRRAAQDAAFISAVVDSKAQKAEPENDAFDNGVVRYMRNNNL